MRCISYGNARISGILLALAVVLTISNSAFAVTSGSNGTHDPSRMLECDGKLYIWSTGGGGMVSTDGMVWSAGSRLPFGSWVDSLFPSNQGMWAPDGIYYHGLYWLFYTVCNTHDNSNQGSCANGLWTTPTLDPKAPNYKLTDRGMVNRNIPSNTWACMDPGPFVDTSDNLWLVWGGGGWTTRLDNTTGMISPLNTATPGNHMLPSQKGEAGYMHYRAPYYYFFWNTGGCCNGIASTYVIHMARSKTLAGAFDINDNKTFYSSGPHTTGAINGPGQIGIANICGTEVFTYHYYPDGHSILGVNYLTWSSDGWPVAGAQITSPLKPCGSKVNVMPGSIEMDKSMMQIHSLHNGISIQMPSLAPNSQLNVTIFSVAGKKIMSASVKPKNGTLDIFDNGLTTGTYYVSIADNNRSIMSSKFVVMK